MMTKVYHPKNPRIVLENLKDQMVLLTSYGSIEYAFAPGERRIFNSHQMPLFQECNCRAYPDGFIHMGCVFFAVEVDGMRHALHENMWDKKKQGAAW